MSFTQEKRIKVRKCQGCEKHCEFGVKFEESKVMHEGKLVSKQCVYPTLGGNAIKSYLNSIGVTVKPGFLVMDNIVILDGVPKKINAETMSHITEDMLKEAQLISYLCDHYKTR
ncbi:MAG: hypothetical protein IJE79_03335 [Alphaproteobacteria bacterium]|nr:hypothetical protein [Alphaproteobacteria bacterium]